MEVNKLVNIVDFKINTASLRKTQQTIDNVGKRMQKAGDKFYNSTKRISAGFAVVGGAFSFFGLRAASRFEDMQVSFSAILGDVEKALKLTTQLENISAKTPFNLTQIANSTKRLITVMDTESAITDLKRLGDIAAVSSKDIEGITSAYVKGAAKGKVQGEVFDMFTDRGIPVLESLSKVLGTTMRGVQELGAKGQVSFEDLREAIRLMTIDGGFAHNGMEKLSKTLSGKFSTAMDGASRASDAFFKPIIENYIKPLLDMFIKLTDVLTVFLNNNPALSRFVFLMSAVIIGLPVLGLAIKGLGLAIGILKIGLGGIGVKIFAGTISVVAIKIIAVIAAVSLLILAFDYLWTHWGTLGDKFSSLWDTILQSFKDFGNMLYYVFWSPFENLFKYIKDSFANLIPDWIKNMFTGGATANVNVNGSGYNNTVPNNNTRNNSMTNNVQVNMPTGTTSNQALAVGGATADSISNTMKYNNFGGM